MTRNSWWVAGWWWLAAGWLLAGCGPGPIAVGQDPPYTFYLAETYLSKTYAPLDTVTLAYEAGERPALGLVSANGSTGVGMEHASGRANPDPETSWIVVYDLPGGVERSRFHPPVSGLVSGASADGARLLLQPFPPPSIYPPPVEYYALDAADGSVIGHVGDVTNACFRQFAFLDPAGERLYCLTDAELEQGGGLHPVRIIYYKVGGGPGADAGRPAGELVLPDALIGQRAADEAEAGWELVEPALALSPNGRTLAVVHAESEAITLVDAETMTVERTFTPRRGGTVWDLLGLGAHTASAKMTAAATIRGAAFSHDGRILYVYSQIIREEGEAAGQGLAAVDLARERVVGEALGDYRVQWALPAADGTVYAFGAADEGLGPHEIREDSPSRLWRLEGETLAVLAERAFVGFRGGRMGAGNSEQ